MTKAISLSLLITATVAITLGQQPGYQNGNNQPGGYQGDNDHRGYDDPDRPRDRDWNRAGRLAPGTEITVRTIDRIDVNRVDPNQRFRATIDRDVRDENGKVVIPRGANANLVASDVGHGEIAIDLRSVFVEGQRYVLNTENVVNGDRREDGDRHTGEVVGGSAVVGGILGAIVGGGKGAAVGAVAGGAAGASAEMMTRGSSLRIPPEAILDFKLDRPVVLYQ